MQRGSTMVSPDADACGVAAWNKRPLIVEDISCDPEGSVRTLQRLKDIGVHVAVAEGVEDRQQWDFLKAHGCDHAQGCLTGKPLAFDGFLQRMRAGCVVGAILPRTGGETGAQPVR